MGSQYKTKDFLGISVKTRSTLLNGRKRSGPDEVHASSISPCGVYLKFGTVIGRGAVKTVYRGLDSQKGIPIAWCEIVRSRWKKKDRQRFMDEAQLLSLLSHPNILRCCGYWEGINKSEPSVLITEYMTSGTLKSYIRRFKKVSLKIAKNWCVQILKGLKYLHTRNPPIIHRDLKCDNIFVQGPSGCIKIGDLGLATRAIDGCATSLVGTPEFMAAEMYDGYYDESVDIYAFGMCMIEILTSEYPYSECISPSQIYKNVTSGIRPSAYFKVEDPAAGLIIRSCIQLKRHNRPNCTELLNSPFFAKKPKSAGHARPARIAKIDRIRLLFSSDSSASPTDMTPSSPLTPSDKSSGSDPTTNEITSSLNSPLMSKSVRDLGFRKIRVAESETDRSSTQSQSTSPVSGATAPKLPKPPASPTHRIKRFTVRLVDESVMDSVMDYRICCPQLRPIEDTDESIQSSCNSIQL